MLLTETVTPGLVVGECVKEKVGVLEVVVPGLVVVALDDVVVLGLVPGVVLDGASVEGVELLGVLLDGVSVEGVEGLGVGVVVDGLGVGVVVGLAIASRFVLPKMRVFLLMSIATSTPLW